MLRRRAAWTLGTLVVLLLAFVLLFDWNWLRGPVERYVTRKTQREFHISHLGVSLGLTPTIHLRDVSFANAPWSDGTPMARAASIDFSVSLRDAFEGRILIPRVALNEADLRLERMTDGRKNWVLTEPSNTTKGSALRIGSLSVTHAKLKYVDHAVPFTLDVNADSTGPAPASGPAYTTRYRFNGLYHDAKFGGEAQTGDVLSFQETGVKFPLRGHLEAGATTLDVEGSVADAAKLSAIDVRLRIAGRTLANLYPFLLLPLPASPPYKLEGHLTMSGDRYGVDELKGQIGATDISGSAGYVRQQPRPLLQAKLHSKLLDLTDLGPLIGVTTKSRPNAAPPTQAETQTRRAAQAKERETSGERVLPAGTPPGERLLPTGPIEGGRMKAIDADAELSADKVRSPDTLAVDNVRVGLRLKDGVLHLDPFDVSVAGGQVQSKIVVDAGQPQLHASVNVDATRLQLVQLLPRSKEIAKSKGVVGGRIALTGTGDSIADLAAKANGQAVALISAARVSNLLDAAAGLNGGKIIRLLLGGDKDIAVRCGAAAFDVKDGEGVSKVFTIDTEQTRIDGSGRFDLGDERFDLLISPKPKQKGFLSLRTPVKLYGSFRHPEFSLEKQELMLRAGGAIALGLLNPLAALLPLVETGPGDDAQCGQLFATAKSEGSPDGPAAHGGSPATPRAPAATAPSAASQPRAPRVAPAPHAGG